MRLYYKCTFILALLFIILAGFRFCPISMSFDPQDKSVNVPADKAVSVTFSMAPQPSSINENTFFLMDSTGARVKADISVNGKKASLKPYQHLKLNETFSINVKSGIKGAFGLYRADELIAKFTTAAAPPPIGADYRACTIKLKEPADGAILPPGTKSVLIKGVVVAGSTFPAEMKAGEQSISISKDGSFEYLMLLQEDNIINSCLFIATDERGVPARAEIAVVLRENEKNEKELAVITSKETTQTFFDNALSEILLEIRDRILPVKYAQYFITTWDGYRIDVDVFAPKKGENLPFVLFSPSWGMDKIEYYIPCIRMALDGYVTATYSARGTGKSTGINNAAGSSDMKDISTIIDFVVQNYPVDQNNIGMSGISMGAIRSYLGCLNDNRIKTIAAMSGTVNFRENMYKQNSPNLAMALSGPPFYFADAVNSFVNGTNLPETFKWLDTISAASHMDKFRNLKRPLSVYISNGYEDQLMDSNSLIEFFSELPVAEKVIDFNDGTHIFPEGFGCIGLPERTWTRAYKWFDYYLKGKKSDITERIKKTKVGMQLIGVNERLYFDSWPTDKISNINYYLAPKPDGQSRGRLITEPEKSLKTEVFASGQVSPLKLIPNPSILDEIIHAPIKVEISKLDPKLIAVYETLQLNKPMIIAGIPELMMDVTATHKDAQLIAYLLDAGPNSTGRLISHSAFTLWNTNPGEKISLNIEFGIFAYRMAKNHKMVLVIDTQDKRYGFPVRPAFKVCMKYEDSPVLKIPVSNIEPGNDPVH